MGALQVLEVVFSLVHWDAANHLGLDATLVGAASNLEESLVTPVSVPRVAAEPVLFAVFNSPAKNTDGVAAKSATSSVMINARLVGGKVFIDDECTFDWTVLINLSHDCFFIGRNTNFTTRDILEEKRTYR